MYGRLATNPNLGVGLFLAVLTAASAVSAQGFIRGDANADGVVNKDDLSRLLQILIRGHAPPVAADVDDDEAVGVADFSYLVEFLYLGGSPPPGPFPRPGIDPTRGRMSESRQPAITILSPKQGEAITSPAVAVKIRVRDESSIARVLIDGIEVPLAPEARRSLRVESDVALEPGPRLIRVEAVDEFGNASFDEVAVARTPFRGVGDAADGIVMDVSGSTAYPVAARVLESSLRDVPRALDEVVSGFVYLDMEILPEVRLTVTGKEAKAEKPVLRLSPAEEKIRADSSTSKIELSARGRLDYPDTTTSTFSVDVTVAPSSVAGGVWFDPDTAGTGVEPAAGGFSALLGPVEVEIGAFLDPYDIRDDLPAIVAAGIRSHLAAQLQDAVANEVTRALLPRFAGALARLVETSRTTDLELRHSFEDILETPDRLTVLLDTTSTATSIRRSFPGYPGSHAEFAPFPGFPLDVDVSHVVDTARSISVDSINQLVSEATARRGIDASFDLVWSAADCAPITIDGATLMSTSRLWTALELRPDDPIGLRIETRKAPILRLRDLRRSTAGESAPDAADAEPALLPEGSEWLVYEGGGAPHPGWTRLEAGDEGWAPYESGFGAWPREDDLPDDVHALVDTRWIGAGTSLYVRGYFEVPDPERLESPLLRVQHTGGFVAHLNGEPIAEGRPPEGEPEDSEDSEDESEETSKPDVRTVDVPLAPFRGLLREGVNVIAIELLGITPQGFVLVPELFDRVPKAITRAVSPHSSPLLASIEDRAESSSSWPLADLDFTDLEVTFFARTSRGLVDLFAVSLDFLLETRIGLDADRLVFSIDAGDGEDANTLPDSIGGAIDIRLAYEAVDLDDERLVEEVERLLPQMGPFLVEALETFEIPALPLPKPLFSMTDDGTDQVEGQPFEALTTTLVSMDTNGGNPDWICLLSKVRGHLPPENEWPALVTR